MKFITENKVINDMYNRLNLIFPFTKDAYLAILSTIEGNLAKHNAVRITGLGTFMMRYYKSRKGHDPKTGKKLMIKSHYFPSFKASTRLKRLVNQKKS